MFSVTIQYGCQASSIIPNHIGVKYFSIVSCPPPPIQLGLNVGLVSSKGRSEEVSLPQLKPDLPYDAGPITQAAKNTEMKVNTVCPRSQDYYWYTVDRRNKLRYLVARDVPWENVNNREGQTNITEIFYLIWIVKIRSMFPYVALVHIYTCTCAY